MKLFFASALAIAMSAGMAFAQDNTMTGSTTGADKDPAAYLAGPNIQRFYSDDAKTILIPEAEFKTNWQALSAEEQANYRAACQGTKDSRWSTFCNSIGAM
jgi:hypothetical protein